MSQDRPATTIALRALDVLVLGLLAANLAWMIPALQQSFGTNPADVVYVMVPPFCVFGAGTAALGFFWWRARRPGQSPAGALVAAGIGFGYGCVASFYAWAVILMWFMRDWTS